MKCFIIGSAPNASIDALRGITLKPTDLVICADGGYDYAMQANIWPHIVIGDFDSTGRGVPSGSFEVLEYNSDKDDTDTCLAVFKGLERGATKFVLCACTGGRFDHMYANVQLLLRLEKLGYEGVMIDEHARYYWISSKKVFKKGGGRTVSLFAMDGGAKGVTLKGFKYPLENYDMASDDSVGISNVVMEDGATVEIDSGRLFVIEYSEEKA